MNILVIEDEKLAADKIISLIKSNIPGADVLWTQSVEKSIKILNTKSFDLIFSDIELLDGNVFDVFGRLEVNSPIIFCTAYNTFYTKAFETNGIAYLLKPYTEDQFNAAYTKYKTLFNPKNQNSLIQELKQSFKDMNDKKTTLTVKEAGSIYLIKMDEVVYFQAKGDFVIAKTFDNKSHILSYRLSELTTIIDSKMFFQINRSEIVNFNCITKIEADIKSKLAIHLINSMGIVYTSNSRSSEFKQWIELH